MFPPTLLQMHGKMENILGFLKKKLYSIYVLYVYYFYWFILETLLYYYLGLSLNISLRII